MTDESDDKHETEAPDESAPSAPEQERQEPEAPAAAESTAAPTAKERRQRARAGKRAKVRVRPPRTPEERHEERVAERARKAELRRAGRQRARSKARAGKRPAESTAPRAHLPRVQKTRQGVVVSDRAEKTITVRIDLTRRHRRYEKIVRTSRTLHAHDELGDAHVGDKVIVRESRPLSRTKRWRLVKVVERAR